MLSHDAIEVDYASEHPLPPVAEDISSLGVSSVPPNTSLKLHHNMEYHHVSFSTSGAPFLVQMISSMKNPPDY